MLDDTNLESFWHVIPDLAKISCLLEDIQHIIKINLEKLQTETRVDTPKWFQEVLFPTESFYAGYQKN